MDCIEFFNQYPQYKLILKGGGDKKTAKKIHKEYKHLLDSSKIIIDREYLPENLFIEYLSQFRIGFCFYDWSLIKESFNYQTAPSGKLLMYLAAATPVIACNIPGFRFIEESKAGILIDDYDPETINAAVKEIESNYDQYSINCYNLAKGLSFDKKVQPYVQFLLSEQE